MRHSFWAIPFLIFGLSCSQAFAQDQQCSYIAPREASFSQNIFFSSIPLCGLPDINSSDLIINPSLEKRTEIEQKKQYLKSLINAAYLQINTSSDKQEKADLKSAISLWRREIFSLNYKMIVNYKTEILQKIEY